MSLRCVTPTVTLTLRCFCDFQLLFRSAGVNRSTRSFFSVRRLSLLRPCQDVPSPVVGCKKTLDIHGIMKICSSCYHNSTSDKRNNNVAKVKSSACTSISKLRKDWMPCGKYQVHAWSLSGVETSVVVQTIEDKSLSVAFDIGYATRASVRCKHVFISHGHLDHVSALFQHATKRNLYNWTPATYYVPPHLVAPLKQIGEQMYSLSNTPPVLKQLDIQPIELGNSVQVSSQYIVRPFATYHRVPSQGYLIYHRALTPKPHFRHLSSKQLTALESENKNLSLYDVQYVPEVAFTGDTTFEVFLTNPPPDLLKVKLLIMEATYLEGFTPGIVNKARLRGHTHLSEIIEHASLFDNINNLLLIHMSDKYSVQFAADAVQYQLPGKLREKVQIATLAKQKS
ncbi:tRNase Z TRZ2, chloroplastic [Octopus sinensis]|uniref:TRNase Z TRZ2, chloroplastic n=1 Tax=Octopus sinensis TaxID=2607531 RepID=A0A6P7THV5_9MOLL|nr:tRNase Z TRZ2, chloroplastic [Octopus sinensis]